MWEALPTWVRMYILLTSSTFNCVGERERQVYSRIVREGWESCVIEVCTLVQMSTHYIDHGVYP